MPTERLQLRVNESGVAGLRAGPGVSRPASWTWPPRLKLESRLCGPGHRPRAGVSEEPSLEGDGDIAGDTPSRVGWIVVGAGELQGRRGPNQITEPALEPFRAPVLPSERWEGHTSSVGHTSGAQQADAAAGLRHLQGTGPNEMEGRGLAIQTVVTRVR